MGVLEKYLKMGRGIHNKSQGILNINTIPLNGEGGRVDNKIGGGGEAAKIFIFLLIREMVNTLILLLELIRFL